MSVWIEQKLEACERLLNVDSKPSFLKLILDYKKTLLTLQKAKDALREVHQWELLPECTSKKVEEAFDAIEALGD